MSEREEVMRFDFEHPPCKGYGCCGGGGMEKYEDGEYVRYDDYAALRSQLAAAESIAQAREVLIAALRADKDEARAQLTTAERERDEARRALAVLAPMFDLATKEGEGMMAVGLELMRLNKELTEEREAVASFIAQNRALRARAERAERVVEAAKAREAYYGKHYDYRVKNRGDVLALEPRIVKLIEAVRALRAASGEG